MNRDDTYLLGNTFASGAGSNDMSFKIGHIPWNKNKKGIHLSRATEFKKGCKSPRCVKIGTVTQRKHKGDSLRNWIKEDKGWKELAKHNWIKEFGKIIKGDIIHHMNGDATDDTAENLIAMPRKDHPVFHNRWGLKALTPEQLDYYLKRYRD